MALWEFFGIFLSLGRFFDRSWRFGVFLGELGPLGRFCEIFAPWDFSWKILTPWEFSWESSEYLRFQICILSFIIFNLFWGFHITFNFNFREIPFSLIQFPLWEFLKKSVESKTGKKISLLWKFKYKPHIIKNNLFSLLSLT